MKNLQLFTILKNMKDLEFDVSEQHGYYQHEEFALDFDVELYEGTSRTRGHDPAYTEQVADVLIDRVTGWVFSEQGEQVDLSAYQIHFVSSWLDNKVKDYPVTETIV